MNLGTTSVALRKLHRKPSQILLKSSACGFRRNPFLALDALLPVGVRLDQAGIDRKAFAANQPLRDAALQDRFKDAPQKIAFAETAMPVLREGGVIGDIAVEPEPAEPPVRQVEIDLFRAAARSGYRSGRR